MAFVLLPAAHAWLDRQEETEIVPPPQRVRRIFLNSPRVALKQPTGRQAEIRAILRRQLALRAIQQTSWILT